jgi:hypothetical protein
MSEHSTHSTDAPEPGNLRFLRRLVTALTLTMMFGLIAIVILTYLTYSRAQNRAAPQLPDSITLPDGETAQATTFGAGWSAVVTIDENGTERIHVFDSETSALRQSLTINSPE